MLLGDSITQGGFEFNGFAARLARTSPHNSPSRTDRPLNELSGLSPQPYGAQTCTTERWTSSTVGIAGTTPTGSSPSSSRCVPESSHQPALRDK